MTDVRATAFAIIGLLTVVVYGASLLSGALPENALAVSVVGGLVVGVLVNAAFRMLPVSLATDDPSDEVPETLSRPGGHSPSKREPVAS